MSQFISNGFAFDQSCITLGPIVHDSVMSLALLTFGYNHRYCVVNVFRHVEGAADREVIITRRTEKAKGKTWSLRALQMVLYRTQTDSP